jgi:hypothetical protein
MIQEMDLVSYLQIRGAERGHDERRGEGKDENGMEQNRADCAEENQLNTKQIVYMHENDTTVLF